MFKEKKGFGLIEVVIAVGVLAMALITTAFSVMNLQNLVELSRQKVAAVADANRVLEAMRDAANTSLGNLQGTNWSDWALTNVINSKGANDIVLSQENVTTVIGSGNPVPVTVILSWTNRQRIYSYTTTTLMTDRS